MAHAPRRRAQRAAASTELVDFIALLREDPVGVAWLSALAWGRQASLVDDAVVRRLLKAALANARISIDRDLTPAQQAQAAWGCVELAMQREPASFTAPAMPAEDRAAMLHVTTFEVMADWHFEGMHDAATATLAVRSVTDGSERRRILRQLLRQLREEKRLQPKPGARLGTTRVWMSRQTWRWPHGGRDLASLARDAFGLVHRTAADFLVAYVWRAGAPPPAAYRRPHALDLPGRRFRAWTDAPQADARWGAAVHLARLAAGGTDLDGVPETVAPPFRLADAGPIQVLALGHPGTRGRHPVAVRGRQPADDDAAYAKRIQAQAGLKGLQVETTARELRDMLA